MSGMGKNVDNLVGVLYDKRVSIRLKGHFYKTIIRHVMLYGAECWAMKNKDK